MEAPPTSDQLMLFAEASRNCAKISPSPERARALAASAQAYGRNSGELLARLGPDTSSLKMSARCFQEVTHTSFQMTDAYAAGLIDGEGCISITPHNKERIFYARVDVGMGLKGLPALEALKTKYGGSISVTRRASEKWEEARAWRIFGKPLEAFLTAILPHLLLKREQAEYALKLHRMITSLPRRPNGSASWTEEAKKNGQVIKALVSELNRKGPQHGQSAGWFARLVGETWITPQRDLVSAHGWEEFSGTWPRSGYVQNFTAYQLPPLVRLTDATASGLWPTPDSSLMNLNESVETVLARREKIKATGINGNGFGLRLQTAVKMWPTPREIDGPKGARSPTEKTLKRAATGLANLSERVQLWPTPTAVTDSGGAALCKWGGARSREKLRTMVTPEVLNGALNPTFVEFLMGFPRDFTET